MAGDDGGWSSRRIWPLLIDCPPSPDSPVPAVNESKNAPPPADARSGDRYLISIGKCEAVLTTGDGQTASGYLNDVSTNGCCFVTRKGQLRLHVGHDASVTAGDFRFDVSIIRSKVLGTRVELGMTVPSMPADFFAGLRKVGGAIRLQGPTICVVGMLTMAVAIRAMRLIRRPDIVAIDLSRCLGMELAGAGFLIIALERGKRIENVPASIEKLVRLAGIDVFSAAGAG